MSGLMLADKMSSQSEKLMSFETALEDALTKIKELEENNNSPQTQSIDNNLLEQFANITEKAERLAVKISS